MSWALVLTLCWPKRTSKHITLLWGPVSSAGEVSPEKAHGVSDSLAKPRALCFLGRPPTLGARPWGDLRGCLMNAACKFYLLCAAAHPSWRLSQLV